MIKRIAICQIFMILAILCITGKGLSAAPRMTNTEYIVALINQIRQDPMGYADRLGYDRQRLFQQSPWLVEVAGGLELVAVSEFLTWQAAVRNSMDISAAEPDITVNTDYAAVGDIDGVVSFNNFMDPWEAVGVVINHQFKKELDPLYEGKRILLSSEYKLIGPSFRAGRTQQQNGLRNAYFIYACFSSSLLRSEVQVVNMINQFRANPSDGQKYLALDFGFLPGPSPPLFINGALASTAKRAALSDSIDILGHARYFKFPGVHISDVSVSETFPKADPDRLALWIFYSLMNREIPFYAAGNTLFSTAFNEIGPGINYHNGPVTDSLKLTMVSGRTQESDPEGSRIYGVVFRDKDRNGVYTSGEEAADRVVSVYDNHTQSRIRTAVTNRAGHFCLTLPRNRVYNIQTVTEENRIGKLIYLSEDHYFSLIVN